MKKTFWKLVHEAESNKFYSFCNSWPNRPKNPILEYSFDNWTDAPAGTKGIFVFGNRQSARNFLNKEKLFTSKKLRLFKCEVQGEPTKHEVPFSLIPHGTYYSKSVRLIAKNRYFAYKVLTTGDNNTLRSYNISSFDLNQPEKKDNLIYQLNKWKYPYTGEKPLFVFDNLKNARAFYKGYATISQIFYCEIKKPMAAEVHFNGYDKRYWPDGTILTEGVKLLKKFN